MAASKTTKKIKAISCAACPVADIPKKTVTPRIVKWGMTLLKYLKSTTNSIIPTIVTGMLMRRPQPSAPQLRPLANTSVDSSKLKLVR